MAVDGNRLIMENGPKRIIGTGESINILHPSLKIFGTLTKTDKAFLKAMKSVGIRKVMLSFVEHPADIEEVQYLLPSAEVAIKIETEKGMNFVRNYGNRYGQLVAARSDLKFHGF
jgi:pyruvate kinase